MRKSFEHWINRIKFKRRKRIVKPKLFNMRKLLLITLCISLFACESETNKQSRLNIDRYSRRLTSSIEGIVNSRDEEGQQSKLTMNSYYGKQLDKFSNFNDELSFEIITETYKPQREQLLAISKGFLGYLNLRRLASVTLIDASNSLSSSFNDFKSAKDFWDEFQNASPYLAETYFEMSRNSLIEGQDNWDEFVLERQNLNYYLINIDSIRNHLEALVNEFNSDEENSKLTEKVVIPSLFSDTLQDFLYIHSAILFDSEKTDSIYSNFQSQMYVEMENLRANIRKKESEIRKLTSIKTLEVKVPITTHNVSELYKIENGDVVWARSPGGIIETITTGKVIQKRDIKWVEVEYEGKKYFATFRDGVDFITE